MLFENYPEELLNDFLPDYINIFHQYKLMEELKLADLIATAVNVGRTKSGGEYYRSWRHRRIQDVEELKEAMRKDLTVFEKIRRQNQPKRSTNTVFDKLKRFTEDGF